MFTILIFVHIFFFIVFYLLKIKFSYFVEKYLTDWQFSHSEVINYNYFLRSFQNVARPCRKCSAYRLIDLLVVVQSITIPVSYLTYRTGRNRTVCPLVRFLFPPLTSGRQAYYVLLHRKFLQSCATSTFGAEVSQQASSAVAATTMGPIHWKTVGATSRCN